MSDALLAHKWADEDPTGWWISEKLDGVRALWRRGAFVSRGDHDFRCPEAFLRRMPIGCVLDGELWGGRQQFQKTVGIVKSAGRGDEWNFLTFMVFDVLEENGASLERRPFEERLAALQRICGGSCVGIGGAGAGSESSPAPALLAVPMRKCRGRAHLQDLLADVERRGGEGLMLRQPGSIYEHRRSRTLLKVKSFHDEEAIVVGHDRGRGRNADVCGALVCKTPDGRQFKVGSGLTDEQRKDPPKVGAVITYRYQELTAARIPRFPTLAGVRIDLDWCNVCSDYIAPGARLDKALKKKHSVLFGEPAVASTAGTTGAAPVAAASSAAAASTAGVAPGAAAGSAAAVRVSPAAAASSAAAAAAVVPGQELLRPLSWLDVLQLGAAEEDLEDLNGDGAEPPSKRMKLGGSSSSKPVCIYGTRCYRKNALHFEEFQHPWLDKENQEVEVVADDAAEEVVGAAAAGSARASDAPRRGLHSLLLSSHTSLLGRASEEPSTLAVGTAVGAPPGAVAPEASTVTPMLAASAGAASAAAGISGVRASLAAAAAAPTVEALSEELPPAAARASAASGAREVPATDVRIFALRNLLRGLAEDSGTEAERAHFTRLLGLVDAGAHASSEAPGRVSAPTAAAIQAPAMPEIGETSVLAAAAAAPAAPFPSLPSPTVSASEMPGDARERKDVETLRNMGFEAADVETAVDRCGTLEAALEWLLSRT